MNQLCTLLYFLRFDSTYKILKYDNTFLITRKYVLKLTEVRRKYLCRTSNQTVLCFHSKNITKTQEKCRIEVCSDAFLLSFEKVVSRDFLLV